jgi:hypothetical protein
MPQNRHDDPPEHQFDRAKLGAPEILNPASEDGTINASDIR